MSIFKRKSGGGKLDFSVVKEKAEELVKKAAAEAIPGEEKAKLVIEQLVTWFDAEVDYEGIPLGGALDLVDGPILRFVLGIVVHQAYELLVERGVI